MRTKFFILAALVSFALFTSCDDDKDIRNVNKHVPAVAQERVNQAYPNTRVEWEYERDLIKAEIYTLQGSVNMWFQKDGTWVGTEQDYNGKLSDAITIYVQNNYPGYYIDDVDIWETPGGTYFELELEPDREIKRDVVIKITETGQIVN